MNKMIKGSVAGATGIALLMGGFGTYALWSDSEDLAANGVQSGELDIDTSAGVYDDLSTGTADDWTASDLLVPGDRVSYTQTFTVKGTGKNLAGTIAYTEPALTGDFTALTHDVVVTVSGGGGSVIETAPGSNQFEFSDPFGTATLTAVVTYELPGSTTGDQNKTATLPAAAFTISQS